jgi:hypothetical protein
MILEMDVFLYNGGMIRLGSMPTLKHATGPRICNIIMNNAHVGFIVLPLRTIAIRFCWHKRVVFIALPVAPGGCQMSTDPPCDINMKKSFRET